MSNETAVKENVATLPIPQRRQPSGADVFADPASFEHAQRVAKVLASSKLVPPHFQGNVADCIIALQIARRLNEEPMTVCQQLFIINGRPGWATAYMISRVNRSGVFKGRITWKTEGQGEALAVTASATLADTGEAVSVTTDMRMAKAENWTKNAKYTSMPEHMLRWRSAAMLVRLYCPEVMLGMPVIEEIETMPPAEMRDVTPKSANAALDEFAKEIDAKAVNATDQGATGEQPSSEEQQRSAEDSFSEEHAAEDLFDQTESVIPTDSASYVAYVEHKLSLFTDADAVNPWFVSDQERDLRNKCGTNKPTFDALLAKAKARAAELKKPKTA